MISKQIHVKKQIHLYFKSDTEMVRSHLFELINHLFELARERERERERERDESCLCEPTSARLSLQAMRLSYFKNTDFTPSLQRNIPLRVSSLSKLFY